MLEPHQMRAKFNSRFNAGKPDECWRWLGTIGEFGYGDICFFGKYFRAHRVAYFLANGTDPAESFVRHKCDNPCCVNPAHLELGTAYENAQDMVKRGRVPYRKGDASNRAKLTEAQVREILRRRDEPKAALAVEFKMSKSQIKKIVYGFAWTHLQPPAP